MTTVDDSASDQPAFGPNSWSNTGRWGPDDQLGTLNFITAEVRIAAARLVEVGETVSLAQPIQTRFSAVNVRPAWHVMHLETERTYATADSLHLHIHGLANTHIDSLGHMFLDGVGYNGRPMNEVVDMTGLTSLDVGQMRNGIVTRGVLLDVAAEARRDWLEPGEVVGPDLLEEAERIGGVVVGRGDALFVHVGLERREAATGAENPAERAGLSVDAVGWLHSREISVYSGDCIERFPLDDDGPIPMPLHQIGIARMGLVLLDCPSLTELMVLCERHRRQEFMLTVAPLNIPGGTGSPVNPIAVF